MRPSFQNWEDPRRRAQERQFAPSLIRQPANNSKFDSDCELGFDLIRNSVFMPTRHPRDDMGVIQNSLILRFLPTIQCRM
jgi:hypothetical protein